MKRLLALILLLPLSAWATTRTVNKSGGADHTTVQACANVAVAGDICEISAGSDGIYNEFVVPANDGSAGSPITYRAASGATVYVYGFNLTNRDYITIGGTTGYGLILGRNYTGNRIILFNNSTNIEVSHNTIGGTATEAGGLSNCIHQTGTVATDITIRKNTIAWCGLLGDGSLAYPDATKHRGRAQAMAGNYTRLLFEDNNVSHLGDFITSIRGDDHVYRGNIIGYEATVLSTDFGTNCNATGGEPGHVDGWYVGDLRDALMENNIMRSINADCGDSGRGVHFSLFQCATGFTCARITHRFNLMHSITQKGTFANTDAGSGVATSHLKSYHNTTSSVSTTGETFSGWLGGATNGADKNNIYDESTSTASNPDGIALDNTSDDTFVSANNFVRTTGTTFVATTLCGSRPGNCNIAGSEWILNTDPLFTNPASDWSLQGGSTARNAGAPLTTVATADTGSGTSLVLDDCANFHDGHGMTSKGVIPDQIAVGTITNVAVIAADGINYSTCTVTLEAGISRNDGDSVWLYRDSLGRLVPFGAAKPDIGYNPAAVPSAAASVPSHGFGNQNTAGGPSATYTVTVYNSSSSANTVASVALGGTDPTQFNIVSDLCTGSLAGYSQCTFGVNFDPSTTGAKTATVTIDSGDTDRTVTVTGTGIGTPDAPTASLTCDPSRGQQLGQSFTCTTVTTDATSCTAFAQWHIGASGYQNIELGAVSCNGTFQWTPPEIIRTYDHLTLTAVGNGGTTQSSILSPYVYKPVVGNPL